MCTVFRTSGQFIPSAGPGSTGDCIPEFFPQKTGAVTPGAEVFDSLAVSPEESEELRRFDEFLSLHVQPNMIRDVQCKLLWNEWVRSFRRQTHRFPNLILEKEFNTVVTDRFGVGIADDGFRGAVYPGIRYVP